MRSGTIAPFLLALTLGLPLPGAGQKAPEVGREVALALEFEALEFRAPEVERRTLNSGTPVFYLEDRTLPLVVLYARFKGGFALLPREYYAAATAIPGLLRSGGTLHLPPDSVDHLVDFYALQTVFGGGGESSFSSINTLTEHLEPAVALWGEILKLPRFDSLAVEVWRGRQGETIRRRKDNPSELAFAEFNRIMFGDHPIGWEMTRADLDPDLLSPETLAEVHARVFCPENLILGAVGDVGWESLEPLLEEMMAGWPSCAGPLEEPGKPEMRQGPGIFIIPRDLPQSTVVLGQSGGVSHGSGPEYYASRIGNSILGAGGFSSRLLTRIRTERGWAYSASSVWTAPFRREGMVGAVTQTKSESTVAAIQLILDTMEEMRNAPPTEAEVNRTISRIVNGFVFNFQDRAQIVSREMYYLSQGLRANWLEEYLEGIQRVSPRDVLRVFQAHVDPEKMIILILGSPEAFDLPPEVLGPVQIWDVDTGTGHPRSVIGPQRGAPRFHR